MLRISRPGPLDANLTDACPMLDQRDYVLPLMFGFNDLVMGRGFVAEVNTDGRGALALEGGEWWMSGVNPGGVAASGATEAEALASFRNAYRLVLKDSAMLANSFEEFSRDVKAIFASTTLELIDGWKAAVVAIHEGAAAGPFKDLPSLPSDGVSFAVTITRVVVKTALPKRGNDQEFCVPLVA